MRNDEAVKLELTPEDRGGGGRKNTHPASSWGFLPLTSRLAGQLCRREVGRLSGGGAGAAPVLSTDQLQRRQASVTCDSQCQFHARGNYLRKSWAGFTFDKKSAAFVFVKRRITECDRSQRLPGGVDGPVWSLSGTRKYLFQMGFPAGPHKPDAKINCQSLFTAVC